MWCAAWLLGGAALVAGLRQEATSAPAKQKELKPSVSDGAGRSRCAQDIGVAVEGWNEEGMYIRTRAVVEPDDLNRMGGPAGECKMWLSNLRVFQQKRHNHSRTRFKLHPTSCEATGSGRGKDQGAASTRSSSSLATCRPVGLFSNSKTLTSAERVCGSLGRLRHFGAENSMRCMNTDRECVCDFP